MEILHKSPTTIVYKKNGHVVKHFLSEDAQFRFEKELEFYKSHKSENLLKFLGYDSKKFSLKLEYAKSESPGFLDTLEAENLTSKDLERIKQAMENIQAINDEKIIVHNDLAPHNIYLTDDRVIIADWDSYFLTVEEKFRNYDWENFLKLIKSPSL